MALRWNVLRKFFQQILKKGLNKVIIMLNGVLLQVNKEQKKIFVALIKPTPDNKSLSFGNMIPIGTPSSSLEDFIKTNVKSLRQLGLFHALAVF